MGLLTLAMADSRTHCGPYDTPSPPFTPLTSIDCTFPTSPTHSSPITPSPSTPTPRPHRPNHVQTRVASTLTASFPCPPRHLIYSGISIYDPVSTDTSLLSCLHASNPIEPFSISVVKSCQRPTRGSLKRAWKIAGPKHSTPDSRGSHQSSQRKLAQKFG
jgi:hypothetical protein